MYGHKAAPGGLLRENGSATTALYRLEESASCFSRQPNSPADLFGSSVWRTDLPDDSRIRRRGWRAAKLDGDGFGRKAIRRHARGRPEYPVPGWLWRGLSVGARRLGLD